RPTAGAGPLRGGAETGADRSLRVGPRRPEARQGDAAGALGRLAGLQGEAGTWTRPQPGRLPRPSPFRLPRRRGTTPARAARALPVGLPERTVESHPRALSAPPGAAGSAPRRPAPARRAPLPARPRRLAAAGPRYADLAAGVGPTEACRGGSARRSGP